MLLLPFLGSDKSPAKIGKFCRNLFYLLFMIKKNACHIPISFDELFLNGMGQFRAHRKADSRDFQGIETNINFNLGIFLRKTLKIRNFFLAESDAGNA